MTARRVPLPSKDDGDALQNGFTLYFKIFQQLNLWRNSLIPIIRNVREVYLLVLRRLAKKCRKTYYAAIVHRRLWSIKCHVIDESVFSLPLCKNIFAIQTSSSLKNSQRTKEWVIVFHAGGVIGKFCSLSPPEIPEFTQEFLALLKALRDLLWKFRRKPRCEKKIRAKKTQEHEEEPRGKAFADQFQTVGVALTR